MKKPFRSPSVDKLRLVFGKNARQAKRILGMNRVQLEQTEGGAARVRECYTEPPLWDIRMHALNHLAGTHGVETIALGDGSFVDYLNTGETYAATLYRWRGNYHVGSWGDLVERHGGGDLQEAIAANGYAQH